MHTRKASFRLSAIIAIGVLALAACATQQDTTQQDPCIEERKTMAEYQEDPDAPPTYEQMEAVRDKHRPLIRAYPHYIGNFVGRSDDDPPDVPEGITVRVTELTDPTTLPEEQRIPACLDGVPVRIIQSERSVLE